MFTNKPPCGPKRGHGTPQPRFALECHFDKIAERLGIPVLTCAAGTSSGRTRRPSTTCASPATACASASTSSRASRSFEARHGKLPFGKGLGFAVGAYLCGAGLPIYWNDMPHSSVDIRLDRSGGVDGLLRPDRHRPGLRLDAGQRRRRGARRAPRADRLISADTDLTPVDLGSYSSRVTFMAGNAAIGAASRLRNLLVGAAADELDVPVDELVLRRGALSASRRARARS